MSGSRTPKNKQATQGRPPTRPAAPSAPPVSRRSRREAERQESGLRAARTAPTSAPAWRSPLALMTFGAVAVGVLVVALIATGVLGGKTPFVSVIPPGNSTPVALASGRTVGAANAPVTMDLWSDFQCPACNQFTQSVEPRLVTDFIEPGRLKVVYHDFIVIDGHAANGHESHDAATAARCAGEQGQFWPFHDWLFANQLAENSGHFTQQLFDSIAAKLGLDQAKFDSCYGGGQARSAMEAEYAEGGKLQFTSTTGQPQTGINQTPTLIIDGREISPSYDAIAAVVNKAAGGASPSAGASSSAGPSASASPSGSTAP